MTDKSSGTERKNQIKKRTGIATNTGWAIALSTTLLCLGACTPTVKVAADKPITINLNVNIKHEIRVKVEKDLDQAMSKDSGLF